MKVTDIKIFTVDCFRTNWVFVKVYTDEGIDGVGEATLEYKEKSLWGAVEHIKEYLVGQNPLDIEKHWHAIYRDAYWRGGPVLMSALSAVEMALWDILGKHLNVPVYQLLGGKVNDKVRIYVNGWFAGAKEPEEFGAKAKEAVKRGVTAMKWDPFGKNYLNISNAELDKALRNVAAVREAVGNEVDLLIEGHGRFNVPTGIKIAKELEQFKPMFFEEPVPPDNLNALKMVRDKSLQLQFLQVKDSILAGITKKCLTLWQQIISNRIFRTPVVLWNLRRLQRKQSADIFHLHRIILQARLLMRQHSNLQQPVQTSKFSKLCTAM